MFKKEYENIWSKVVDHIAINMHNLLMVFIILTQPVNRWNILKLQNSNLSFFILNFSLFKHFLFWATYVSYNNTCVCLSVFLSVYICTFRIHSFFSLSSSLEPDVMCGYRLYFTNVTWHTAYKIWGGKENAGTTGFRFTYLRSHIQSFDNKTIWKSHDTYKWVRPFDRSFE